MENTNRKLTFNEWKANTVKKDSEENKVGLFFREREWYYHQYGIYCNKFKVQ